MSEKSTRQIRKEMNRMEENIQVKQTSVADALVRQLLNAPFKYRFLFAVKVLFRKNIK